MNIQEFLNSPGIQIKNPNKKSKKDKQPDTITIPATQENSGNLYGDFRENMSDKGHMFTQIEKPETYEKYGITIARPNIDNLDLELADAQSNWNKAWHAVTQTVVNEIGLGTLRGVSDLVDFVIGGAIRTVTGEENDYTNPVSETIKGWQEAFEEYQPIHTTPGVNIANGGLTDFGWWMSNIPSIASSITLLIPSTGFTKAVNWLGKATRLTKGIGNTRKFLSNIDKIDKAANAGEDIGRLGKLSQWVNNENTVRKANEMFEMGVNGFTSRIMENYQESNQVYQDLLPEIYNGDSKNGVRGIKDMSDEEYAQFLDRNADYLEGVDTSDRSAVAKRIAKEAADRTFKIDMINGFFDVYELYGLRNLKRFMNGPMRASVRRAHLNSIKYAGKTEDEIKAILKGRSFGEKAVEKVSDVLYGSRRAIGAQISEGIEEAINYVAQEEGLTYGHILLGTENESSFWDNRLIEYAKNPQLYESAFWGVLGGVVFQAAGSGLARAKNAYDVKRNEAKYKPDDKTKEAVKKTPWSEAFEMPEMQARLGNIEARARAENTLRSQLEQIDKGINPFEKNDDGTNKVFESEEEKIIARDRAFNQRTRSLLMDAMFVGNWDITRAYLESDEVRDALVSAGIVSQEEAVKRQAEIKEMADKMEDLYSRNLRAVGNAMRGKDDATGADFSSIPTEYFQIIAAENMAHQLDAEQYDRNIAQYAPIIGSEEVRLKEELDKNGINYKEVVRSFILAQQLGQIDAELNAAKKTLKQGRTKNNIDARTISGQSAIRELELRKRTLTNMLREASQGSMLSTNEGAKLLVTLRAAAATESNGEGGYKMNINSERYKKLDANIVNLYNSDEDSFEAARKTLSEIHPFFANYTREQFREAAHLADVFNENIGIALGEDGAIENLDNLSHNLLMSYATVTYNEIAREIELVHIAKDREGIRTLAHNKHNDMQSMRGIALESALYSLKGIAKNYSEEFGDISDILAYGTLNSNARNRLKEILSEEDMRTYDDAMKIIALNRKSVTGSGEDTSAINTLLPEMVKDALYRSSQDEFEEVVDEPDVNEDDKTSESSSASQNASESEKKADTTKTSSKEEKADTSEKKRQIVDFHITKSGNRNANPVASISVNSDGAPIKLNQYSGTHNDYTDVLLIQSEEDDHTYELDFKREINSEGKDGTEEVFNNPHFFKVNTPIINGGQIISNPKVVVDDDGKVVDYMPGVIDNPDSAEGQEEKAKDDESKKEGVNAATIPSTGGSTETKIDKEVDPATFDEPESSNADEAKAAQESYEVDSLYDDLKPDMVNFALRRRDAGEDYDENALFEEIKNKYKDTVSEEDLAFVFNKVKSFGRKAAGKLKLNIKEFNDIANFIYESSLSDSDLGADEKSKARKELEKTFDNILENYAKRSITDTYNGKKVISLENLLRYANEVAGDSQMGELLYEKFVELLKQKDDYFIVEGKKLNQEAILAGAAMSEEEKFDLTNTPNGKSIDFNYLLRKATKEQKEKIYDIIDDLVPNTDIDFSVRDSGRGIEFKINGISIGTIPVPKVTATDYVTTNKGWIVDIPRSNDGSRSKLEQLFIRIMINPDNEKDIKPIVQAIQKAIYTNEKITNKETGKQEDNPEYKKAYEDIINKIRDAGIYIDEYINFTNPKYNEVTLGEYIISIYRYVKSASEQWLGKTGLTVEEYNEAIKNRRIESIHNWFERLKDSYSTAVALASNQSLKVKIDSVNQGGLIRTKREDAEPINADGVIGSKHKGKLDIVVASINEIGKLYSTDGTSTQMSAIRGGSTFISIPRSSGEPALVHAFPQTIGASHLKGEMKEIQDEILTEFDRLLSEWSDNPFMSADNIANFINKLCSSSGGNNALFKGFKVTSLTGGFEGIQIEYTKNGRKQYIKLFDGNQFGKASVIKFNSEKATAFKTKDKRKEVLDKFKEVVKETLTYNIEFDYVKGNRNLKGFARRGTKGQFIIQIPNGKEHSFKSFKDFVIDNGLVAVTTKSTNGKTNFYRPGESYNQVDKPRVTFKIVDSNTTPVEERTSRQPEEPIATTTKKGDSIKTLIENNSNSSTIGEEIINSILNGTQLNILKNSRLFKELSLGNVIFVNKISGAIAAHFKKDKVIDGVTIPAGTIAVTQRWIDLLNSEDSARHEEAVRHLIHESIHRKIDSLSKVEQRKLFDTIREIFNEFVAANERDGIRQEFAPYEYNTNKTSERLYYKNGELNDRGLEEFLVETITRPALIKRLNEIATDGNIISKRTVGNIRSKNLFQKILAVIAKLFDLNINKGSLLEKEYKLFEQIGLTNTQQEQKTETKPKPKAPVTQSAVQLELKFDETDNNNETVTTVPQESPQQPQIATDVNNITVESAQMMDVDEDDIDESAISDEEINATSDTEVASVGQVRDTIIPENRETFERLVSKGAIQINC